MSSTLACTVALYNSSLSFSTSTNSAMIMSTQNHLPLLPYFLFLFLLVTSTLAAERCHRDDKKALLAIKKSFQNAYVFASWTPETDCCKDWYMVRCDLQTDRIVDLHIISPDQINGSIPNAVGDLLYLTNLQIHKQPKLTGPIPRAITRLKNLTFLTLTNNNLTGPVPGFLSELKELFEISLSFNNLTGSIPPSLANLPKLQALSLDRNRLTGPIPESFGGFKTNQDFYLVLTKNQLSGPIPKSLGGLNFTSLHLDRNNFTGDASMFFGKDKGVQIVDVSRNRFSFNMTNLELPASLNYLDVNHNLIYGSIPRTVANLESFNASYNRLCGQIPNTTFGKDSFIHNKCLCGSPLPACK